MTSRLPRLIGLIGRKGSGKDTAASALLAKGYENVKFAGALKGMIAALLAYQGVNEDTIGRMIEGDLKEVPTDYLAGQTPRYAMQTLGTQWGRDIIGKGFWVGTAMAAANKLMTNGLNVVITDIRFPNEVKAITSADGSVYGVVADWIEPTEGEHESEALIDGLIDALPASQKIVNRLGVGDEIAKIIQEFQMRFLTMINYT